MTTTKCDICGLNLDFNHRNPTEVKGKAELIQSNEAREFTFSLKVESFHFNCTNFHVCQTCLTDAVARSVDIMSRQPVEPMP